jgi:lysophospholipase L1-like esterase
VSVAVHPALASEPSRLGWKHKVLLASFGLFLSAVVMEGALRILHNRQFQRDGEKWASSGERAKVAWAVPDADLRFRQNPAFADMNSDGLRNAPIGPKQNSLRILMLGDSVAVWGDGVHDTLVAYAQQALGDDPDLGSVEVINAGQMAYTNYQELVYLKKYGLRFAPDLVGVQFCLNDLHRFHFEVAFHGQDNSQAWWERQARRSHLYRWAAEYATPSYAATLWRAARGFAFDYRADIRPAWQDSPWAAIEEQMREFRDIGRARSFPVFVVGVPLAIQYERSYLERDRDYVLKPQKKLGEICERLSIPLLDLHPHLDPTMFLDDGMHLSAAGRKKTGRLLAEFLKSQHLVPPREQPRSTNE